MKNQILTLIVGILIGAVITTGVFLFIRKNDNNKMPAFDRNGNFGERMKNYGNNDNFDENGNFIGRRRPTNNDNNVDENEKSSNED